MPHFVEKWNLLNLWFEEFSHFLWKFHKFIFITSHFSQLWKFHKFCGIYTKKSFITSTPSGTIFTKKLLMNFIGPWVRAKHVFFVVGAEVVAVCPLASTLLEKKRTNVLRRHHDTRHNNAVMLSVLALICRDPLSYL